MGLPSRRGDYTPRRTREQRAYRLAVAGGVSSAVAAVGFLLSLFGVISLAIPFLAALVAVACLLLFRRTVSG